MKKVIVAVVILLAVGGYLGYPYARHHWALHRLHEKGIDLAAPKGIEAQAALTMETQTFVGAACGANAEVLALLLQTRFDVNSKFEDGTTALHCAAAAGRLPEVRLLLDHGADLSARRLFLRSRKNDPGFAPIHLAAAWHHLDVIQLLKERGASIDEPSEAGPPLMVALAVRGQERFALPEARLPAEPDLLGVYEALQRLGARLDVVDDQGNTLLHVAMKAHQRPLIEAMLAGGGFDLNAPNTEGETPFMLFVRGAGYTRGEDGFPGATHDLDLIARLIEQGANVNARSKPGYALILGSAFQPDLFEFLIRQGADPFVAQSGGRAIWSELMYAPSPSVIAIADKLPALKIPLQRDGKPGSGPLHVFARQSRPDLVAYFLKRGVSANEPNDSGNTPLHEAFASSGGAIPDRDKNTAVIRLLLDAGADSNARNQADETPLMMAGRHPPEVVRMLIVKGADVNAIAKADGKAKHVLDYFSADKNLEGFTLLMQAGASKTR
jgi:ankyrin repeat protein